MKKIGVHLGLMGLLLIVLATATMFFLRVYTKHDGELVKVKDLDGIKSNKAIEVLESMGLEGVVTDTVFKDGAKKLAVVNQNPAAGLNVKRGRKIYLVINTDKVPMVMMPDLAEKTSLPQAQSILKRAHLRRSRNEKDRYSFRAYGAFTDSFSHSNLIFLACIYQTRWRACKSDRSKWYPIQ